MNQKARTISVHHAGRFIQADFVQDIAGLDFGTFHVTPFLDQAADLRPDFRHPEGRGPARQLFGHQHRLRLDRHHDHFRHGRRRSLFVAVADRPTGAHEQGR